MKGSNWFLLLQRWLIHERGHGNLTEQDLEVRTGVRNIISYGGIDSVNRTG
jgi:hypothetical protein